MNHCNTCIKQGRGCVLEANTDREDCRAWEAIPAEPTFSASLATAGLKIAEESAKKAEQEHDLAIWWEAYLAALGGYDVARILSSFEDAKHSATSPKLIADQALSDYRAKREELCK